MTNEIHESERGNTKHDVTKMSPFIKKSDFAIKEIGVELLVKRFTPADIQLERLADDQMSMASKNLYLNNKETFSENQMNDNLTEMLGKSPSTNSHYKSAKRLFQSIKNSPYSNFYNTDEKQEPMDEDRLNLEDCENANNMSPINTPKNNEYKIVGGTPRIVASQSYGKSEKIMATKSPDVNMIRRYSEKPPTK